VALWALVNTGADSSNKTRQAASPSLQIAPGAVLFKDQFTNQSVIYRNQAIPEYRTQSFERNVRAIQEGWPDVILPTSVRVGNQVQVKPAATRARIDQPFAAPPLLTRIAEQIPAFLLTNLDSCGYNSNI
jgi:hypothetical protein